MFGLLIVLLILVGAFLTVVILLQSGKGGGLASMGGAAGTDTLIGGRQAATLLTKATWVSGGLFLFLAFVLAVMSSRQTTPQSILRGQFQPPPAAPQPLQLPGSAPAEREPPAGSATPPATRPPATTTTGN